MRLGFRLLTFLILVALGASSAAAQPNTPTVLTGTVLDGDTGEPLIGANVFIAASMMGTTTNNQGQYRLERVPTGAHRLYVSMLGYEPGFRDILLRESRVYTFDFNLAQTILEVGEIVVEAERDEKWQQRLEKFTSMFIGETPNAMESEITNPEVLDFEVKRGTFKAVASEPLIIENRALGYRIRYFLKDFKQEAQRTQYDGEPLFEEMSPESREQAELWRRKRREAFMGSFRHFLLALLSGRTEKQGFKTYSRPGMQSMRGDTFSGSSSMSNQRFPIEPASILKPGKESNEKMLDFEGYVEIIYMGETEDPSYFEWSGQLGKKKPGYQTSWIILERGPALIDYKGDILDPYGVTFSGYLAFERVANEVPKEFRPR
jgi:CarboxypepD_reg-like domain